MKTGLAVSNTDRKNISKNILNTFEYIIHRNYFKDDQINRFNCKLLVAGIINYMRIDPNHASKLHTCGA